MSNNLKVHFSSKHQAWETPSNIFNELDKEFNFNLDAAANASNHKCERYFDIEDNGLEQDWGGQRVFLNPPYGRELRHWVKKAYEESKKPNTLIVMLIPARTDTIYFHNYIYYKAKIRFIRGRIKFLKNRKEEDAAPFPSMIVIYDNREEINNG